MRQIVIQDKTDNYKNVYMMRFKNNEEYNIVELIKLTTLWAYKSLKEGEGDGLSHRSPSMPS